MFGAILAAGVGAALVNAWGAHEANKTNKEALKQMDASQRAAFEQAERNREEIQSTLQKISLPNFDGQLTEAEIKALTSIPQFTQIIKEQAPDAIPHIAAEYPKLGEHIAEEDPEIAKFIAEKTPELVQGQSIDAKEGRAAMKSALKALRRVGTEGDTIAESERTRALQDIAKQEAGMRGALTEQMARRGQLSGGRQLLMELAGQQASMETATQASMQSAEDAQKRRLQALRDAAGLGSQMYGQEVALEARNVDAINAFNQRNTASQRQIEAQRVQAENARKQREAQAQRRIQEQNIATQNIYQQQATEYDRRLAEQARAEREEWKRRDTQYERDLAQQDYEREVMEKQRADAQIMAERARGDDIRQQQFANEMQKAGVQAGIAQQATATGFQQAEADRQRAQAEADRQIAQTQAITRGITDVMGTGVQAYGAYKASQPMASSDVVKGTNYQQAPVPPAGYQQPSIDYTQDHTVPNKYSQKPSIAPVDLDYMQDYPVSPVDYQQPSVDYTQPSVDYTQDHTVPNKYSQKPSVPPVGLDYSVPYGGMSLTAPSDSSVIEDEEIERAKRLRQLAGR